MTQKQGRFSKLSSALDDAITAGENARLQLHLLKLRARDGGEKLEQQVRALEDRIESGLEQALQSATQKAQGLAESVRALSGNRSDAPGSVRAIMTDTVYTCSLGDSVNQAAQLMWEHDCGAIPIVDAAGKLSGIITDRDICMAAYTHGTPLPSIRVDDAMSGPAHACQLDDKLARAATLMAEAQVRRLPVVDAEQRPVGIVSMADIARVAGLPGDPATEPLSLQLLKSVSKRRELRLG